MPFASTTAVATSHNSWVSSTVTVSGFPETKFDYHSNIVLLLNLTHPTPSNLIVALTDPSGYSSVIGNKVAAASCSSFYVTMVADNQTYQTGTSPSIPCPPTVITGDANTYYTSSSMSASTSFADAPITSPLSGAAGGDTINGNWKLQIYDSGSTAGTLHNWTLQLYSGCVGSPCLNGGTCTPNGWGQGSYTCKCPAGTTGANCGSGILGSNFYQISNSAGYTNTPLSSWVTQTATAAPPFAKIDWTVAIVLIPNFSSCPEPGLLRVQLVGPSGYGAYATYTGFSNLNGCNTLSGKPVYDNQTIEFGSSSSSSVCSATSFTGYGLAYVSTSDTATCFTSGCSTSQNTGIFTTAPFAVAFQQGTATAAGTWTFGIYDSNTATGSNLQSWIVQFYRISLSRFSPSSLEATLTAIRFHRGMHQQSMCERSDLCGNWLGCGYVHLLMRRWLYWTVLSDLTECL